VTKLNVALIGFGWFAELLVTRVLASVPQMNAVAVLDPSPQRRVRANELGLAAVESMAALPAHCQAVIVLTPHDTHRDIVEQAAAAGLHVFCEKAFAVTSEDCVAMIDACSRAGVALFVGHMQKLFPGHARVIELCQSQKYGQVVAVQVAGMHWCPVFPGWWRTTKACGGLLYWTGVHDIDTLRAIVGSDTAKVFAVVGPKTDAYTDYEDAIAVTLVYKNGVVASMQVAEHNPLHTFEESFEISVLLERGAVKLKPYSGEVTHSPRIGHERGEVVTELHGPFADQEEHAYRCELSVFVAMVSQPPPHTVSASAIAGLRCVETLEAIYQSVSSGQVQTVVQHAVD